MRKLKGIWFALFAKRVQIPIEYQETYGRYAPPKKETP